MSQFTRACAHFALALFVAAMLGSSAASAVQISWRTCGSAKTSRAIRLSSSQVYRLVVDRPERLSLKVLMALLDILDCSMSELIEPVAAGGQARTAKAVGDGALDHSALLRGVERLSGR